MIEKTFKGKILKISITFLFFALLIASLVLRNFLNVETYYCPVFFIVLVFFISQYFGFEYKILVWFSLILMLLCVLFVFINESSLAEFSGIYTYIFLILGATGFLLDYVRERIKKNNHHFKVYRLVFLFFIILVIIYPFIFYREYIPYLSGIIKNVNYYFKKEDIELNGTKLSENIIINIEYPEKDSVLSGVAKISGWAIEANSKEGSGIDKIDIFIDGKPGIGKYLDLGEVSILEEDSPTYKLVSRFYKECYGNNPDEDTLNYWVTGIESGKASIDDMVREFILNEEFESKNLSNEEYINLLYKVLLNREADKKGFEYWLNKLNEGIDKDEILYDFLDSFEYKGLCRNYYGKISKYLEYACTGVNLRSEDISERYGEQFKMSSFNFLFNSTEFKNGKHILYFYAHSPVFGWDYIMIEINIEN